MNMLYNCQCLENIKMKIIDAWTLQLLDLYFQMLIRCHRFQALPGFPAILSSPPAGMPTSNSGKSHSSAHAMSLGHFSITTCNKMVTLDHLIIT